VSSGVRWLPSCSFLNRIAAIAVLEASAQVDAACARRTLFAGYIRHV
jgi:hypothetical protein